MSKIKIGLEEFTLTFHAMQRLGKRKITLQDVEEAIKNPKIEFRRLLDSQGFYTLGKNKVKIIFDPTKKIIITVINITKAYHSAKSKSKRNDKKRRLRIKKKYGNRAKTV